MKSEIDPGVSWGKPGIIALLPATTLAMPGVADAAFKAAQDRSLGTLGWFYNAAAGVFLVVVPTLGFGPAGKLKFGPDDAGPDVPYLSWRAMLLAAGIGIGPMYFAVAEPLQHHISPLRSAGRHDPRCARGDGDHPSP